MKIEDQSGKADLSNYIIPEGIYDRDMNKSGVANKIQNVET
jgi:hypothetical protein